MPEPVIFTIEDPGWDWGLWVPYGVGLGITGAVLLLLFGISRLTSSRESARRFRSFLRVAFFGLIASIPVLVAVASIQSGITYANERNDRIVLALEERELSRVNLVVKDGDLTFTGILDGDYVKGFLKEPYPFTWQIIVSYSTDTQKVE